MRNKHDQEMRRKPIVVSEKDAFRAGKRDARSRRLRFDIPPWEPVDPVPDVACEDPSQWEQARTRNALAAVQSLLEDWAKDDEPLLRDYCTAQAELKQADRRITKEMQEALEAKSKRDETQRLFDAFPRPHMSRSVALIGSLILVLLEFPVNRIVFQILNLSQLLTDLTAVALGVLFLSFAHAAGETHKNRSSSKVMKAVVLLGLLITLTGVTAFSYIRAKSMEGQEAEAFLGVRLSPTLLFLAFAFFNAIVLVIGFWLAYSSSHEDPGTYRTLKKQCERANTDFLKEDREAIEVLERRETAEVKIAATRAKREKVRAAYQNRAMFELTACAAHIRAYRRGNLLARRDRTEPASFRKKPEESLPMPDEMLAPLDWSCRDER